MVKKLSYLLSNGVTFEVSFEEKLTQELITSFVSTIKALTLIEDLPTNNITSIKSNNSNNSTAWYVVDVLKSYGYDYISNDTDFKQSMILLNSIPKLQGIKITPANYKEYLNNSTSNDEYLSLGML
jgi:hypothetical protein